MKIIHVIVTAFLIMITVAISGQANSNSQEFIRNVFIANKFEILSSQVAVDKIPEGNVKQFANEMIDGHRKIATDLKTATDKANLKLPEDRLDARHQKLLDELKSLTGAEFDKRYAKAQADGHAQAVTLFEDYTNHGETPALKDFAIKTLPVIKQHKEHADKLVSDLSK